MNIMQRLQFWGDSHHSKWLDILRIALGIFLFYKGFEFLQNMGSMVSLMAEKMSFNSFALMLIGHYIVFAHLLGGFLLALGLLTRFACLIQIPVLLGAIIFINSSPEMMRPFSELSLSILTLLLLVFFLIVGDGPWSFEWFVRYDKKDRV